MEEKIIKEIKKEHFTELASSDLRVPLSTKHSE